MNVLVTSSSSKVLLVKGFISAAADYGAKIFTGDTTNEVATAFVGDKHFVLPRTSDRNIFIEQLAHICEIYGIKLIVPTRDGELSIMSDIKDGFAENGITILVPSKEAIEICLNKRMFSEFLNDIGLNPVPVIDDLSLVNPPYFIRPVYGASSIGVKTADTHEEAKLFMNSDFLVHPFIDSDEFSIDLLMDLQGEKALQAVCRQRVLVIGGESKISRTIDIPVLEQACLKIGQRLGLVGHNVLQAFYSEDLGVIMIEANARFGGASNLSINAGLNSPVRIMKMLVGDESAYDNEDIKFGLSMYRYSEDIIYEGDTN
ncbi:hypothetical protein LCGC14_0772730 [marine sediment metagenome]|uniref:PylC N-terminal domain-containing protein n=1 Tax=marine sediment metagenome TaxID=412755 RepID=A0A0F9QHN6_9ZZZZ